MGLAGEINAALDEVADDKHALSQPQREQMEAQISGDMLAIERSECALIWHAEAKGEVLDLRGDTTPQPLLGVRLVNPGATTDRQEQARSISSRSQAHDEYGCAMSPNVEWCDEPRSPIGAGRFGGDVTVIAPPLCERPSSGR